MKSKLITDIKLNGNNSNILAHYQLMDSKGNYGVFIKSVMFVKKGFNMIDLYESQNVLSILKDEIKEIIKDKIYQDNKEVLTIWG